MRLKDQSMALRWVSENIEWYGGPKRVTLVGLNGSANVHYHYLSPMSAGLFQVIYEKYHLFSRTF